METLRNTLLTRLIELLGSYLPQTPGWIELLIVLTLYVALSIRR